MEQFVENLQAVPAAFWSVLLKMSPYLLLGFFAAGVLSVLVSPRIIERHLGGGGLWPSVKAAVFGVPLPLCSCGVIPVAASLRRHRASRGATTAFLISTPQTGADSMAVTYSLLGPVLMVFRPVVALVSGILGGGLVTLLEGDGHRPAPGESAPPPAEHAGRGRLWRMLHYGFVALPADLARSLLVGLLLAAGITALVPESVFVALREHVGGVWLMLVMMAAGIPVYVCATASVPIAAALIAKGIPPGAAMVFLMTGPATNAATLATVWKTMGRRTAAVYLATVAGSALAAGLLLDGLFPELGATISQHIHRHGEAAWRRGVQIVSAAGLLAMLGYGLLAPWVRRWAARRDEAAEAKEPTMRLDVRGMTCSHCARTVQRTLLECAGVRSAQVDLAAGRASVDGDGLDVEAIRAALKELGYDAEPLGQ